MRMKDLISPLSNFFKIQIDESYFESEEWSLILDKLAKDKSLFEHSQKVTYYAMMIFDNLHTEWTLTEKDRQTLFLSAFLHDIGKLSIMPEGLLSKVAKLTAEEFIEIKRHPVFGFEFISKFATLKDVLLNILHHHERYDGRGYPNGLTGNNIPLLARIISVADSFDAMTSLRPYKKTFSMDYALGEILENAGCQFDPAVAECFIDLCKSHKVLLGWAS
jgi:HD-GYP domain-containing protein (c-di-GMP phosphodiesterase class II)